MTPAVRTGVEVLDGLPAYTRAGADTLNLCLRLMPSAMQWPKWFSAALSGIVKKRGPVRLHLIRATEGPDSVKTETRHTFEKDSIVLGRDPECDLVLSARVVGQRHTRIVWDGSKCTLEDLGSPVGTHLNGKRIPPNQPQPIRHEGQFVIFPDTFTLSVEQTWVEESVVLAGSRLEPATWSGFLALNQLHSLAFDVAAHPTPATFRLQIDRAFLEELVDRSLPGGSGGHGLVASDRGLLEFLVISILNIANRELRFPFQCSLRPEAMNRSPEEPGVAASFSIGLSGLTGACRIFLPAKSMQMLLDAATPQVDPAIAKALRWLATVQVGEISVLREEVASVETGDVILLRSAPEMILPAGGAGIERGWVLKPLAEDPWRFQVMSHFARQPYMEANPMKPETAGAPQAFDPGNLPTRVQVVLSEVQLSLAELGQLHQGGILDLNRGKKDPVKLLVNGTPLGSGELVDLDGTLGVRITVWGGA